MPSPHTSQVFHSFSSPARVYEPGPRLTSSQCPAATYDACKSNGTTGLLLAVETLHVQLPCHTSDSERYFNSDPKAERLKNEGWKAFQPRQDRGSGVEKPPISEITVGARHDGGPRRHAQRKDPDQPPALFELPVEPAWRHLGRAIEDDHIIGPIGRVAIGSRRGFHDHIADPELAQNTLGPFGQRRTAFGP